LGANVKIVLDSYKLHRSAIIAVNHTSWLDPIVLVDHLPFRVFKQIIPIYFLAGERFFHKLWLRPLLSMSGAIPLKSEGLSIEDFFSQSIKHLKNGSRVLIFPEGKTSKTPRQHSPKSGYIYLAKAANVPIIPARIVGLSQYSFFDLLTRRKKIDIILGDPIYIPKSIKGFKQHKQKAVEIMDVIYKLTHDKTL